jgi:hypothetical protein
MDIFQFGDNGNFGNRKKRKKTPFQNIYFYYHK